MFYYGTGFGHSQEQNNNLFCLKFSHLLTLNDMLRSKLENRILHRNSHAAAPQRKMQIKIEKLKKCVEITSRSCH